MFSDKFITSLEHKARPYRVYEAASDKGFGIQVSTHSKVFFLQYKSPLTHKRRFMRLGKYPDMPIRMAREQCRNARMLVDVCKDPQLEREERRKQVLAELEKKRIQAELEKSIGTVTQLFEAYIANLQSEGKRAASEVEYFFNKDVKAEIGHIKAREVTPFQIRSIIRKVYMRGAKVRANHTRSFLMAAYSFGIKRDNDAINPGDILFRIDENPVRNIPVPTKTVPRDRNLSADEIQLLWHQLEGSQMSKASKTVIRLLLATGGQRVEEVLFMRWDELDFDRKVWELTSARTKNNKPHVIPLSDLAIGLIKGMRDIFSESAYVFPSKDDLNIPMPYHTITRAVNRFCCPPKDKSGKDKYPAFPRFVPKDIRRTVKSRMGELGVSKDIRDRLQNHALHDVSSKHYDRYDYLQPKKEAIEIWTSWLNEVISKEVSIEIAANTPQAKVG